jgi:effector-binding domain-containing protein
MSQAVDADRIRTLRFLEMPLPEIRAILAGDPARTKQILEGHRDRLHRLAERQRYAIGLLDSMLREEPPAAYEVRLRETQPQPAASIRGRTAWAEIGSFVASAMMEVGGVVAAQGVRFAGPPYTAYYNADSSEAEIDLEVGLPVDEPVEEELRVRPTVIPGGLVATTVHAGPYESIAPAYRALGEWVQEHGHETAGPQREIYLSDPSQVSDPGALRTEIVWPVR